MSARATTKSSDLPTKTVRTADGTIVRKKVVRADSETFDEDFLAAFRSNVRRVRRAAAKRVNGADTAKA